LKNSKKDIEFYLNRCIKEIETGISRPKPPDKTFEYDGGILALPTNAPIPTQDDYDNFRSVSETTYILNCGATNWEGTKIQVQNGQVTVDPRQSEKSFSNQSKRTRDSLEDFVEEMAELLYLLLDAEQTDINSVGIVLGFPQKNSQTDYGIEAEILENQLPKEWYIKGDVNRPMGKLLKKILRDKYNINLQNVFFGNDAALMMWDLSLQKSQDENNAPIGGVWGSGMNFGITSNVPKWQDQIINTEIGRARSLLTPQDYDDFEFMKSMDCAIPTFPELEIFVGGDYLFYLLTAKVFSHNTSQIKTSKSLQNAFFNLLAFKGNSHLVSEIIAANELEAIKEIMDLQDQAANTQTLKIIKNSAKEVFDNATLKMAITLAGFIKTMNLDKKKKWVIPIEGSVINKGYKIYESFTKQLKRIIPEYQTRIATESSSKKALAIFTSILSHKM
jgi:hypothetical protein